MSRRNFLAVSGAMAGTSIISPKSKMLASTVTNLGENNRKMKIALVGTGIRGTSMWGRSLVQEYADFTEFVGLCDHNPGRLEAGKRIIGVDSLPSPTLSK